VAADALGITVAQPILFRTHVRLDGGEVRFLDITIDVDKLRPLALKAIYHKTGKASAQFGAITIQAKVPGAPAAAPTKG
jgi:hypothetical protein